MTTTLGGITKVFRKELGLDIRLMAFAVVMHAEVNGTVSDLLQQGDKILSRSYRLIAVMVSASILHHKKRGSREEQPLRSLGMTSKRSLRQQWGERGMTGKQQRPVMVEEPPRWRSQPEQCNRKGKKGWIRNNI